MWPSRSLPSLITLAVVLPMSVARAGYGGALDYLEARVRDAAAAVDAAQCALDDARARLDAADAELRQTVDSISALEQSLADARRRADEAAQALAAMDPELPARQAARDDAERRARDADAVVRQIHDGAWGPFSQSPEYVQAERVVAREKARVDEAVEQVHGRLAEDPDYGQLQDDARAAEEHLEALRDDPRADPNVRAAASQRWLDAKAAVQRYRDEAIGADSAVRDARAALDEASRRHSEMLEAFAASLDADPRMREARDALHAAESVLASADLALRESINARDAAARELQNAEADRNGREVQLAEAHARVDELGQTIGPLDDDVRRSENDLSFAIDALEHALHERDAAASAHGAAVLRHSYDYGHGRRLAHDKHHRDRHHEKDHDRKHDGDGDRGKRYERHDRPDKPNPEPPAPTKPPRDRRDSPGPRLIDEEERERIAQEEEQQQADARRALRERREAEWQTRREENKRRQEEAERAKAQQGPPPAAKPAPQPARPRPREVVPDMPAAKKGDPQPAPKVGPEPPPREPKPREAKKDEPKREPKKEEPRKSERKDDSPKDRGDRYRKGK